MVNYNGKLHHILCLECPWATVDQFVRSRLEWYSTTIDYSTLRLLSLSTLMSEDPFRLDQGEEQS